MYLLSIIVIFLYCYHHSLLSVSLLKSCSQVSNVNHSSFLFFLSDLIMVPSNRRHVISTQLPKQHDKRYDKFDHEFKNVRTQKGKYDVQNFLLMIFLFDSKKNSQNISESIGKRKNEIDKNWSVNHRSLKFIYLQIISNKQVSLLVF